MDHILNWVEVSVIVLHCFESNLMDMDTFVLINNSTSEPKIRPCPMLYFQALSVLALKFSTRFLKINNCWQLSLGMLVRLLSCGFVVLCVNLLKCFPSGWAPDKGVLSLHDQGWQNFNGGRDLWECGLPGTRDPCGHQVEWILLGDLRNHSSSVTEEHCPSLILCLLHSTA